MTDEELEEIRSRSNAATQGPWVSFIEGRDHTSGSSFIMRGSGSARGEDLELLGATVSDIDFIAHARQDVPTLLAEVARLRELLSKSGK